MTGKPCFWCPFKRCLPCKYQGGAEVQGSFDLEEKENRPTPNVGAGRSITRKDTNP